MEEFFNKITPNNLYNFIIDNNIIGFLVTIFLTIIVARLCRRAFNKFITKLDENKSDKTNYYFLRYVLVAVVYGIGFTLAIYNVPSFRAFGTTLLAGAGVFALAISFASQQALSNIVSGLFIVIFKPFKINDRIRITSQSQEGVIEDITLRHTVIRNYENKRVIVPNSIISNETIINSDYSGAKVCRHLIFGIGYNSSITKAKEIITEECLKHPLTLDNRTVKEKAEGKPIIVIRVVQLGESSVDLKVFVWVSEHQASLELASDLYQSVKERFDKEGVLIPYPHRTIEMVTAG